MSTTNKSPRIDEQLQAAYESARYFFDDPGLKMRIGMTHPELDEWVRSKGAETWVFLTPCNPFSQMLSERENAKRLAALRIWAVQQGLHCSSARAGSEKDDWPEEEGCLLLGPDREQARQLGVYWQQNAVVYGQQGGIAELIWCI